MNKKPENRPALAWAGILGPVLFVAVFTIEGWLRPGYDPYRMYVSELALGPRGWIQNVNFILFGVLFLIFTRGVADAVRTRKAARGGNLLLTIIAVCYLAFGFFPMDPLGTPPNELSFSGIVHFLLGEVVLVLMPVSCFVFLRYFRKEMNWRFLLPWTLFLGVIIAAASSLLLVFMNIPAAQGSMFDWLGLVQRLSIVPYMLWLFLFALVLLNNKQ